MKHMPLDEWDRTMAPILGAITIRTSWIIRDMRQIAEWLTQIPAVPEFETEAMARLKEISSEIGEMNKALSSVIDAYESKEKVT